MRKFFFSIFILLAQVANAQISVETPPDPENWIPMSIVSRFGSGPFLVNDVLDEETAVETPTFYFNKGGTDTLYVWDLGVAFQSQHNMAQAITRNVSHLHMAFAFINEFSMPVDHYTNKYLTTHFVGLNPMSDFNENGFTDGQDLEIWQNSFLGETLDGDANRSGKTDSEDFILLQRQMSMPTGAKLIKAVPEPGCILLLIVGIICALKYIR